MAVLDATGLVCPLPVLKARKLLKAMEVGEVLEVSATDPAAARDFAAFCGATGNQLIEQNESEGRLFLKLKKSA